MVVSVVVCRADRTFARSTRTTVEFESMHLTNQSRLHFVHMNQKTFEEIRKQIRSHDIVLYMKGTPRKPLCRFSSHAVKVLSLCTTRFAHVDVIAHPKIRSALPRCSPCATFPQLWVKRRLIGGCDALVRMFQTGELSVLIRACRDA